MITDIVKSKEYYISKGMGTTNDNGGKSNEECLKVLDEYKMNNTSTEKIISSNSHESNQPISLTTLVPNNDEFPVHMDTDDNNNGELGTAPITIISSLNNNDYQLHNQNSESSQSLSIIDNVMDESDQA